MKKIMLTLLCGISLIGLVACGTKVTSDNFNRIKTGMSETEVRSILGKPDETEDSEILGLKNVSYTYRSGDTRVNINFISNTVISKHANFK